MRKQWDFKKRKEFCGCVLALLFAVAFAISTTISIAMAATGDIRIAADNTTINANNSTIVIGGTNNADLYGANSISTNTLTTTGAANVGGNLTTNGIGNNWEHRNEYSDCLRRSKYHQYR